MRTYTFGRETTSSDMAPLWRGTITTIDQDEYGKRALQACITLNNHWCT